MNFDFHPTWMRDRLAEAMFHVKRTLTVSHFRLPLLKRLIPPRILAALDGLCQPTGAWWQLTPSVFVQCGIRKPTVEIPTTPCFRCPVCKNTNLEESPRAMICGACDRSWPVEDGIFNFKNPLSA
jgi:hypothetical protein